MIVPVDCTSMLISAQLPTREVYIHLPRAVGAEYLSICQVPINLLLNEMKRDELETLLRRCQKASRAIQVRNQMTPSPIILASTIL